MNKITEQIEKAYKVNEVQEGGRAYMMLDRIAELTDLTAEQIRTGVVELARGGSYDLAPYAAGDRDRALSVRFGGEDQHMIYAI